MAVAKGIAYANMTPEQKAKAEAWAKKWGSTPDKCPMTITGRIITNRNNVLHLNAEDYEIMTKHDGVECVADITDEIREEYRESLKHIPSKEFMEKVKAKFAENRK